MEDDGKVPKWVKNKWYDFWATVWGFIGLICLYEWIAWMFDFWPYPENGKSWIGFLVCFGIAIYFHMKIQDNDETDDDDDKPKRPRRRRKRAKTQNTEIQNKENE